MPDEQIKNLLKAALGRDATEAELTGYKTEAAKQAAPPATAPVHTHEVTLPGIVQNNVNPELMKEINSLKALVEAERTQREADKKAFEEKQKSEQDKKVAEKLLLAKKLGKIPAENKEAEAKLRALLESSFEAAVEMLGINEQAAGSTNMPNGNTNTAAGDKGGKAPAPNNQVNLAELRSSAQAAFIGGNTENKI